MAHGALLNTPVAPLVRPSAGVVENVLKQSNRLTYLLTLTPTARTFFTESFVTVSRTSEVSGLFLIVQAEQRVLTHGTRLECSLPLNIQNEPQLEFLSV